MYCISIIFNMNKLQAAHERFSSCRPRVTCPSSRVSGSPSRP
ncbi:hypothetical protein BSLA_02r1581 [Burkholderia stabilis]|nr:hypothetical protein BSLA_02r1581 [Burkholderia stabilis]